MSELEETLSDQGLLDTVLEISKRRKDTLLRVKLAIRERDLDKADRLITELVPDEKSNRTFKSIDGRAGR